MGIFLLSGNIFARREKLRNNPLNWVVIIKARTIKQLAGYLSVSALAVGLIAATQPASAGIANTKHNLGSGNLAIGGAGTRTGGSGLGDIFTNGTDEICVFCHTPHGANTSVPVPLWNKGTPASTTYTQWASGSMNGTAPSNLANHMSLACLSCHDGTQAMDNEVNGPGGGSYNATGVSLGYQWFKQNDTSVSAIGPTNVMGDGTNGTVLNALAPGANGGTGPGDAGNGIYYFGTDLSQNHPVGMPYGGGNCTAGAPGSHIRTTTCADTFFYDPVPSLAGGFAVGTGVAGAKSNLRLYGNDVTTATVECGSCHDPHSDTNARFLRKPSVCSTCHV